MLYERWNFYGGMVGDEKRGGRMRNGMGVGVMRGWFWYFLV